MRLMINRICLIGVGFLLFLTGCTAEEPAADLETGPPTIPSSVEAPRPLAPAGFDQEAMLSNIALGVILPAHTRYTEALIGLETAVLLFNRQPGEETLRDLQQAWLDANLARMALLPFRLGPVDESLLHNRMDNRPPRVDFIDNDIIAGEVDISADYLSTIGSSSIGLGAMEYLLFDPVGGDEAVLAALVDGENAGRRRELLLALSINLLASGQSLERIWSPAGANYAEAFIQQGSGQLQSSVNMLVNQMVSDIEDIVMMRLGGPAGITEGAPRPDEVEAPYSGSTTARIVATLEGSQATFTGLDGPGLDDYLDFLAAEYEGEPLSAVINRAYGEAIAALEALDRPLSEAVVDDPEAVALAVEKVRTLHVLLKVDMANQLGVILTFNDNDGD